jgi:hypothetical protein
LKIGLYYEHEDTREVFKVENYTYGCHVLISEKGEYLTINKPVGFKYTSSRVTAKRRIEEFEDNLMDCLDRNGRLTRLRVDRVCLNNSSLKDVNGRLTSVKILYCIYRRENEEWVQINVEDIKRGDTIKVVTPTGEVEHGYLGDEYTTFSLPYTDRMGIDVIDVAVPD